MVRLKRKLNSVHMGKLASNGFCSSLVACGLICSANVIIFSFENRNLWSLKSGIKIIFDPSFGTGHALRF